MANTQPDTGGARRGLWGRLWTPAAKTALGTLVIGGFVVGVLFWGGFHWALEITNTESFCIGCHEMKDNVYSEYRNTVHYSNRSGVRASCPDCHVPKEWQHKIVRKIQASNELWHHFLGSVSTPEKFDAKRIELARHEWKRMKSTDSRECRNCHKFESMDYARQEPRAARFHQDGLTAKETCIDCHRGIAHKLPPNANDEYKKLVEEMAADGKKGLAGYLGVATPANAAPAK